MILYVSVDPNTTDAVVALQRARFVQREGRRGVFRALYTWINDQGMMDGQG